MDILIQIQGYIKVSAENAVALLNSEIYKSDYEDGRYKYKKDHNKDIVHVVVPNKEDIE